MWRVRFLENVNGVRGHTTPALWKLHVNIFANFTFGQYSTSSGIKVMYKTVTCDIALVQLTHFYFMFFI